MSRGVKSTDNGGQVIESQLSIRETAHEMQEKKVALMRQFSILLKNFKFFLFQLWKS
jgi:hypothetical protein